MYRRLISLVFITIVAWSNSLIAKASEGSDDISCCQTKLLAPDGTQGDQFGLSVAISGNLAIIGAPDDSDIRSRAGAVYIYDFADPSNFNATKITAFDGKRDSRFGYSVAIDGQFAVVGARQDRANGTAAGSAYLLDLRDPTNILQTKLLPSGISAGDVFGNSVGISGTTAIVGGFGNDENGDNAGVAYLFDFSDWNSISETKLTPTDPQVQSGFGYSVAIDGTNALVGSFAEDVGGIRDSGAAYLYDFSDANNLHETQLVADDATKDDVFGSSVALSGNFAVVGAPHNLSPATAAGGTGAAYLFDISDAQNIIQTNLTPGDVAFGDQYGSAVAVDGANVVVGAIADDARGRDVGAAYFHDVSSLPDEFTVKALPEEARIGDLFGFSASISGGQALIGAIGHDAAGDSAGAAYRFVVPEPSTLALLISALLLCSGRP